MIDRINELCSQKGINGKELGELLGLKKSPLTDWKNKKAKPTLEQIIKMREIFATSTEYILFGKENIDLSEEEKELIQAYRAADPGMRAGARKLLDAPELPGKSLTLEPGNKAI